jgi:hypothetical protein
MSGTTSSSLSHEEIVADIPARTKKAATALDLIFVIIDFNFNVFDNLFELETITNLCI